MRYLCSYVQTLYLSSVKKKFESFVKIKVNLMKSSFIFVTITKRILRKANYSWNVINMCVQHLFLKVARFSSF